MARKSPQPKATSFEVLECVQQNCPSCGKPMWNEYNNLRHVRTLKGVVQLLLKIRRCQNRSCERYRIKYRPEQEGSWALPQQEFGLDVIALVGALRYSEHRSVPQIHQQLRDRGIEVSERSVIYLLERYDELVALWLSDHSRLKAIAKKGGYQNP